MCTDCLAQNMATSESSVHKGNYYFPSCPFPQPLSSFKTSLNTFLLPGHGIAYLTTLSLSPSLCCSSSSKQLPEPFFRNTAFIPSHPCRRAHCGYQIETPSLLLKASHSCLLHRSPTLHLFCPSGHTIFLIHSRVFCFCGLHTVTCPPRLLS